MSANLYDLQVEILFNGTGDAMRRRILAPLKEGLERLKRESKEKMRVLDVACGTGGTLKLIRAAITSAFLFGIDLSPSYLRKANHVLAANPVKMPQLLQANAEELPYRDNYFHGVTCVFLFHELVEIGRPLRVFPLTVPDVQVSKHPAPGVSLYSLARLIPISGVGFQVSFQLLGFLSPC